MGFGRVIYKILIHSEKVLPKLVDDWMYATNPLAATAAKKALKVGTK